MIEPKCLSKYGFLGWSSKGYILPCCWMDHENMDLIPELVQEKFKLENVSSVEEVIESEEWQNFWDILKESPEDAPTVCHHYCKCTE